jgi:quinol monooxygenase YgiN
MFGAFEHQLGVEGMTIQVRVRFDAQPHQRAAFEQAAVSVRKLAGEEPGVLSYEWFSASESGSYVALEEFADPAAMVTHIKIADALLTAMNENSKMAYLELYGDVDAELREAVKRLPGPVAIYPSASLGTQ